VARMRERRNADMIFVGKCQEELDIGGGII
jgi:hypothetical protein